ncbi:MAG: adenylate/guanylate cyclase domain-containing protein, partial [Hyphomicrobiaceae bacterium]
LPVAIVDIDEQSLAKLGQWPWPRTMVADLVARLMAEGAAAVAFDMVFAEADRLSPGHYADIALDLPVSVRDELKSKTSNDAIMAKALGRARVVLGQVGLPTKAAGKVRAMASQTPVATIGGNPAPFLETYSGLLRNITELEAAATGRGLFSIRHEFDGIVRRVPLVAEVEGQLHPGLAVELLRVATGQNAFAIKTNAAGIASVVVGGVEVPTDQKGRLWVNYTRHDPARFVSAADVLAADLPKGRLVGHLILIGTSAVGLGDLRATPLASAMPGVEIHAQLLETILSKSWLERPQYALGAEIAAAVILSLLMIALMPVLGAVRALSLGALLAAMTAAGGWYLYSRHRMLFDTLYPLGTSFAVFVAVTFMEYRKEEKSRQSIRNAFARYLDPAMVEQLAQRPDRLSLGGETRELTLLFSDVRGFTTISESYRDDPQGLTTLMNRFLTPISRAIIETRGTIDKYMGDAVMAFWNAPLDDPDHAAHACAAALEIVRRLEILNVERAAEAEAEGRKHFPIEIGIGLNTGPCVVGNMGSDVRFDYSVLGDSVNVASRLEGQTKTYAVTILVGAETTAKVTDRFALIEVDLIRVKGKRLPARCFALLGDHHLRARSDFNQAVREIDALLVAYRQCRWDDALAAAAATVAARRLGLAGLLSLYEARIAAFALSPPPPGWDGVFEADRK